MNVPITRLFWLIVVLALLLLVSDRARRPAHLR